MNQQYQELAAKAGIFYYRKGKLQEDTEKLIELIVKECAQLARDTDLEDVEGSDSEVLRAAKRQILEHFGVKE